MSYSNVEVKITVKVDGQRVGRSKVARERVGSVADGRSLRNAVHDEVDLLATKLARKAGV